MTGLWTVREVAQARASAAAPLVSGSVEVTVETARLDVQFATPRRHPKDLELAAATGLAATSARLPDALRGRLMVETGVVISSLRRNGERLPLFSRSYQMASCRGVVLDIREAGGAAGAFSSPWTGILAADQVDPSLPIILAPSAVLALVSYALEVTGGHVAARSHATIPGITVLDTATSPYPPQHHPFEGDGTASPDRPLIEEGCWSNRQEHTGDDVDPLFLLLTRPDRALRPLAASTHFNRRNLMVLCSRTVPGPATALLVDSWRVRVGPRSGVVPFHAELSRIGPHGERLAVTATVALNLDPWEVLARIQGASGPAAPAIDEDPIEGDSYGCAPTLVTGITFADLAGKEGS